MELINKIIAYEQDELTDLETLNLFSELIKSEQCWSLQGHYGRTAHALIENGLISKDGVLNYDKIDELEIG